MLYAMNCHSNGLDLVCVEENQCKSSGITELFQNTWMLFWSRLQRDLFQSTLVCNSILVRFYGDKVLNLISQLVYVSCRKLLHISFAERCCVCQNAKFRLFDALPILCWRTDPESCFVKLISEGTPGAYPCSTWSCSGLYGYNASWFPQSIAHMYLLIRLGLQIHKSCFFIQALHHLAWKASRDA